ncbi:chaplin family protein [Streptomyces sp. NPDC059766]|uniref:chaplin family protein n=1 Tax=Streptomyces sp. NPDC059766 TaxID=3346940 RepID=UPI00365A139F
MSLCGNTVAVMGSLTPALGNKCANGGGDTFRSGGHDHGGSGGYGDSGDRGGHGGYGGHDGGYGGDSGGRDGHGGHGGHDGGYGKHDGGYGKHDGGYGGHDGGYGKHDGGYGGGYGSRDGHGGHRGHGGAYAGGHTGGSPGVGSGNEAQVPIDVPVNACGNSVDVIGLLNPVFGNDCDNGYGGHDTTPPRDTGRTTPPRTPEQPGKPVQPTTPTGTGRTTGSDTPVTDRTVTPAGETAQLAHTGSELPMGLVLPVGAGALLAGAVLYRKARAWA